MVTRDGFSLIEVTVAMVLLSIGLLGVAGSGLLAARLLREAEAREELLERSTSVMDSLVANRVAGAATIKHARYQIEWKASASLVEVRTLAKDGFLFELRAMR